MTMGRSATWLASGRMLARAQVADALAVEHDMVEFAGRLGGSGFAGGLERKIARLERELTRRGPVEVG